MVQSANMNVMIATARKAGRALAKDFREVANLQVSVTGASDFVARADMHADKVVKEELLAARPTYGYFAAESAEIQGKDPTRRWIVDAMVGVTNFQHGMPHYAVTIALEHKGEIVAGVIYDAAQDECFFAEKGQGAWMTVLKTSSKIERIIGPNGILIIRKVFGVVLLAISVKLFAANIKMLFI